LDELDEKPNHSKFSKFRKFEGKSYKRKDSFFNHLIKKLCLIDSKCLALDVGHM
jgi:hypothetical protein